MSKRQVFFSFEYNKDSWRVSQVRNMGLVDNSSTFSDNSWEEVKKKKDYKIKEWIDEQLSNRSCLVVLVGATTANRKWINYEIKKAVELNKGILGIYVHGLKDVDGNQTTKGSNPFNNIFVENDSEKLSNIVTCYDPPYNTSNYIYDDIKENIEQLIETAISKRWKY